MRSLLLVRSFAESALEAALEARPDAIVLDLAGGGEAERHAAAAFLVARAGPAGGPGLFVRVEDLDAGDGQAALAAVLPAGPAGIVLGGTVGGRSVGQLANRLAVLEAEHGLADGQTGIVAEVGSAAGALALPTIPGSSRRLVGLAWNAESLAAELGLEPEEASLAAPIAQLRGAMVLSARAAGVVAIDTVTPGGVTADLPAEAERARRDGFGAKLAAEPGEVAAIARAFARR